MVATARNPSAPPDVLTLMAQLAVPRPGEAVLDATRADGDLPAADEAARFDLIAARLPSTGAAAGGALAQSLMQRYGRTRRPELLRLAWCLERLRPDGRAVVLAPHGLLTGTSNAHRALRRALVEEHRLEAVIRLPAGWAGSSASGAAAILIFAKAPAATTDAVAFYDLVGGRSATRRRVAPAALPAGYAGCDVHPVLVGWLRLTDPGTARAPAVERTLATKAEIAARGYALAWRKTPAAAGEADRPPRLPQELLAELAGLEAEIFQGIRDLVGMIK